MNEDFSISMTDNEKLDDYLCTKILEIFNLYSDKKGYVKKRFKYIFFFKNFVI